VDDFAEGTLSNTAFNFHKQEIFYTLTRKLEACPKQKAPSSKLLSGFYFPETINQQAWMTAFY